MKEKLKAGDRVKMRKSPAMYVPKPHTGIVVKRHRTAPFLLRIRRDGLKEIETFHEDLWRKET